MVMPLTLNGLDNNTKRREMFEAIDMLFYSDGKSILKIPFKLFLLPLVVRYSLCNKTETKRLWACSARRENFNYKFRCEANFYMPLTNLIKRVCL